MKTRPYQRKAIDALHLSLSHSKKALLVLPTGAGKTFTIVQFLKEFGKNALILSHTKEIVDQTNKALNEVLGDHSHESMSIQKCCRGTKNFHKHFDVLIIDECHRGAAKSYQKMIHLFGLEKAYIIGITATPFRSDQQSIYDIFGPAIFKMNIVELIDQKYLVDFVGYRVKTNISLKGISTKQGDFIASRLSSVINVKNRNELIVKEFINLVPDRKAIAFCANLKHCEDLKNEFLKHQIVAVVLHGQLPKTKREEILIEFRSDFIQVLLNCNVLTEGFDEPSVECLLMCRPTLSKTLYMQMIGRGSRKFEGKKNCAVIEFTDNSYDVCCLEDLIESKNRKTKKINNGESLIQYRDRIKDLEDEGEDTIVEEYKFINANPLENLATPWQIKFLKKNNISFPSNLTQILANQMIKEIHG